MKFVASIRSEVDDIQDIEAIMRFFDKIDKDNSKGLDKKEFSSFLLSHDFTSVEVDVLFALIDEAFVEDDNINFVELYEFLQSIQGVDHLQHENKDVELKIEDLTSEESVETEEESEEVFENGDKHNDSKQLMKVIVAEKDRPNGLSSENQLLHDDAKSHTSVESVETEEKSKEVFEVGFEMEIDFAHKGGNEANNEDSSKISDIDGLSKINTTKNGSIKKVSVEFVTEPRRYERSHSKITRHNCIKIHSNFPSP
ncbi:predicted protein [Chaetoceros tenuissimus]|uniref:EF-hand domain-containing protein n=1 Tax=Chaetoceros tenuissimus TaxID=426638 RepID=A0AAD3H297_9STRA|nr:predicted protein [Chaetoceros tenuissimus]